jgi:hypothetical protein
LAISCSKRQPLGLIEDEDEDQDEDEIDANIGNRARADPWDIA